MNLISWKVGHNARGCTEGQYQYTSKKTGTLLVDLTIEIQKHDESWRYWAEGWLYASHVTFYGSLFGSPDKAMREAYHVIKEIEAEHDNR